MCRDVNFPLIVAYSSRKLEASSLGCSKFQRTSRSAFAQVGHTMIARASFLLVAASLLISTNVQADTKACVLAHSSGQREALAGRLKKSQELFIACGVTSDCPDPVRDDCERLLAETRLAAPTVILSVLDEKGGDVTHASVYSGDELIGDGLDGRAIELDPGEHHLRFVLPDGKELRERVLIREGEKNRLLQVQLESPQEELQPEPALPEPRSTSPGVAWAATGLAGAGAAVFGTFAYLGGRKKAELDSCAPTCSSSLKPVQQDAKTYYLVADIGLGAALVSGIAAIYLFATHGGTRAKPTTGQSSIDLDVGAMAGGTGAAVVLSGGFH